MTKQTLPLTAYTEEQRMQAQARFALIRPTLRKDFHDKNSKPAESDEVNSTWLLCW